MKLSDCINKFKDIFAVKSNILEPAEFERKMRALIIKYNNENILIQKLMNDYDLYKLNFDYKTYLCDFSKLYIKTKDKLINENIFDDNIIRE